MSACSLVPRRLRPPVGDGTRNSSAPSVLTIQFNAGFSPGKRRHLILVISARIPIWVMLQGRVICSVARRERRLPSLAPTVLTMTWAGNDMGDNEVGGA